MEDKIKETIEKLVEDRAGLLQVLCEDYTIWQPQIIVSAVYEIRAITKMIKILKGEKGEFE